MHEVRHTRINDLNSLERVKIIVLNYNLVSASDFALHWSIKRLCHSICSHLSLVDYQLVPEIRDSIFNFFPNDMTSAIYACAHTRMSCETNIYHKIAKCFCTHQKIQFTYS